jgi:type IV pilus assembly protein PilY1
MRPLFKQAMLAALVAGGVLGAALSRAAGTDLADKPLANSTTVVLLPNIMLDLDNSGSMLWSYMPDYVRMKSGNTFETYCRNTDGRITAVCNDGDPPYAASAFNKIYYNPAVRYDWPVDHDGTRRPDASQSPRAAYKSPWSGIPSDGYGRQRVEKTFKETSLDDPCGDDGGRDACEKLQPNDTVNLASIGNVVANYPDRVWCKSASSNTCVRAIDGSGYSYPNATYGSPRVSTGAPYYYNVNVKWCKSNGTQCQDIRDNDHATVNYSNWERVDIVPSRNNYPKAASRTDCLGATSCSFEEEITNFATWYAWYRTRAQMAKSSIGLAFKDVRGTPVDATVDRTDANYFHARMGLMTIDNATIKVPIADFNTDQKATFYSELYKLNPSTSTPLRAALNEVGRLYKFGKNKAFPNGDHDPIQAACQRNFTILATDGYWNGNDPLDLDLNRTVQLGDQDGDISKAPRPSYAPYKANDQVTLADVAFYYYNNDLRPNMENIVPSAGGLANIGDVANHQHMTTFTLGLGVDGTLPFRKDYKAVKAGAYYDILQGTKNWPAPKENTAETIDDLWHAAVSGRGTYFSAKDPAALQESLHQALNSIGQSDGSGASAATSNLQPTPGDDYVYVANYRTGVWDGELSAFKMDTTSGDIIGDPIWQATTRLRLKIAADGTDTRTIWTSDASNNLVPFTSAGLSDAQKAFFNATVQRSLSQYNNWSTEQKGAANADTLVKFLRGHDPMVTVEKENRRLYRERDKALGDFVHSQPVHVRRPPFDFLDAGYAEFVSARSGRDPTVYAAANDGMLHAFDARTGDERWAYIPPMVLPDLWQLAHGDYANRHRFFLDGPLTVADVKIGGAWKTILIGAMGKGGRGYYALDITEPAKPAVLWTYTAEDNPNLGYSYGPAHVTKVNDKWVAVLTSGYNNIAEGGKYDGDGKGHVFVLDLSDPRMKENVVDIATTAGTKTNPSGLARLNIAAVEFNKSNAALAAWGGDLLGNMWRFDLQARTATKLLDLSSSRPIMAAPELGGSDESVKVYFGTGRFLGTSDLVVPAASTTRQIVGAFNDDLKGTTTLSLDAFAKHTLDSSDTSRKVTTDTDSGRNDVGWYVELPGTGERVAVDPQLFEGTFVVPTVVPTASDCQPGGYSWFYMFNAKGGSWSKDGTVGTRLTSPIVGMSVSLLPSGKPVVIAVTADGKKPKTLDLPPSRGGGGGENGGTVTTTRLQWRELGK